MRKTPFLLGLTGSIGMGKSATVKMFADEGVPIWDADAVVDRLYSAEGKAVEMVGAICPEAISQDGRSVDRVILRSAASNERSVLEKLEEVIHPLVAADRSSFIEAATRARNDIVVLDIPLLFETGQEESVDAVVVVSAPSNTQRSRVLARGTLTEEQFKAFLARQMPDAEKRRLADFLIQTVTMESARASVKEVLTEIRNRETSDRAGV